MTIRQKEETFLLTKFKASELLNHVTFHFRQPYTDDNDEQNFPMQEYLDRLYRKGLDIDPSPTGIQRRLNYSKIKSIEQYLKNDEESFFPNAVILSTDLSQENSHFQSSIEDGLDNFGELELPDDIKFIIVDGQHRLAGLFLAGEKLQNDFEIPAILLINITINTCAKIFSDVNGKQSTVNKSIILDLYEMTSSANLNDKKKYEESCIHVICRNFNTDSTSPLYRHIKMLGVGEGAISQAFFVNALAKAIVMTDLSYNNIQNIYDNLFCYFRAFQRVFFYQWPVLESPNSYEEFREHSLHVMKEQKSQMLKTNGFGGIMKAFPTIYRHLKTNGELSYNAYHNIIEQLKGKIDWCNDFNQGTGAKNQDKVKERILSILGLKDINKKDAPKTGA